MPCAVNHGTKCLATNVVTESKLRAEGATRSALVSSSHGTSSIPFKKWSPPRSRPSHFLRNLASWFPGRGSWSICACWRSATSIHSLLNERYSTWDEIARTVFFELLANLRYQSPLFIVVICSTGVDQVHCDGVVMQTLLLIHSSQNQKLSLEVQDLSLLDEQAVCVQLFETPKHSDAWVQAHYLRQSMVAFQLVVKPSHP